MGLFSVWHSLAIVVVAFPFAIFVYVIPFFIARVRGVAHSGLLLFVKETLQKGSTN